MCQIQEMSKHPEIDAKKELQGSLIGEFIKDPVDVKANIQLDKSSESQIQQEDIQIDIELKSKS